MQGIDVNTVIQLLALLVAALTLFARLSSRIDGMRREIIEAMDTKIGQAHARIDKLDDKYDAKNKDLADRISDHGSQMTDMQHSLLVPVIELIGGMVHSGDSKPAAGGRRRSSQAR